MPRLQGQALRLCTTTYVRGGHVRGPVFEIRKRVSIPLGQIVLDRLSTRSFPSAAERL